MDGIQSSDSRGNPALGALFRNNELFGGIAGDALGSLGIRIKERHYEAGEIVFDEGDTGQNLYLVGEGSVQISKRGRGDRQETLTAKGPGQFFGEMSILDEKPRSARATATAPSILGTINRDGLERLLAHSPETAIHFTRTIMQGLRSTNLLFIDELLTAERLSLLGTMMSSIMHDLRNPIAITQMLGVWMEGRKETPQVVEKGAMLRRASDRMQTMIQELLDFSRGRSEVNAESTSVRELIESLEEEMRNVLQRESLTVRREMDYVGPIRVDKSRILRLLCNVVKNAVEAMPKGGTLTLRTGGSGDMVHFEIEDTGCGIPPDVQAKIFEPFVTHGKSNGTGLGMAIAKTVVEAHGGSIRLESEEGRGTTFFISLPGE